MNKTIEIKGFGVTFNEVTLSTGVKLYAFYRKNSPISFRTYFYAGSQFDGDKPGLAHFAEHVLLAGTEKYPTKGILNEKIQEIGATRNAFTNKLFLYLTLDIADKIDLPDAFDIVDQILNHSLYSKESIELERGPVMAEQTRKKANPSSYIFDLQSSLLFQSTKIQNSVLGSENTIRDATREDLVNYYNTYLKNGQVAYFIAGDFNLKQVIQDIESINKDRLPIPKDLKKLDMYENEKTLVEKTNNSEQNYISLSSRLSVIENRKDKVISAVCNTIFGSSSTSRLFKKLRTEKGYVYDINSNVVSNSEYAYVTVNTNCKPKNTAEVVEAVKNEFDKLIVDGINQKELDLARRTMIRSVKFNSEKTSWWVNDMASFALNKEYLLLDESIDIMNLLLVEDVNLFIKKYFGDRELLLAGYGDFSDIDL